MEEKKWYVIKTTSRSEKKVAERIDAIGVQSYLPLMQSIRQWSDRKKKIYLPLIPSTLFVFCYEKDFEKFYSIQGFLKIMYLTGHPAVVRDYEIENLKILLKENTETVTNNNLSFLKGDKVEVIRGPLQGLIATSLEENRTNRLIVEIESLDQRFIVHVPKSFVRKLTKIS
jgi:transcriptional antiterminator NusG